MWSSKGGEECGPYVLGMFMSLWTGGGCVGGGRGEDCGLCKGNE